MNTRTNDPRACESAPPGPAAQALHPASGNGLANLAVVRSPGARTLFLVSAAITATILLWANHLLLAGYLAGLHPIFYILFTHFDYPAAMWMLFALLAAALLSGRVSARPVALWVSEHCGIIAAATAAVFAVGTLVVYRDHPLALDEYTVLFQSKVFASGHLATRFPPQLLNWLIPQEFQDYFLNVSPATGQVASAYWPSFSLLLTPFTFLGIPWACNPVISALSIIAIHRLTLTAFEDREAAGLAVLLTLASPVFFADGISFYSMSAHMLANTLFAILLSKASPRRALAAGAVGSVALTLHNPVPHLLFALPWLVWLARRPGSGKAFGALILGYLPLCLLLGFGWFFFSIHLLHAGTRPQSTTLHVGTLRHMLSAFTLPSFEVLDIRLVDLAKIWLWSVPGLLVIAGIGAWKWRDRTVCRLLAASAVLTILGYAFVPFDQGHGWGDRYFQSAWMVLPILAAGALTRRRAAPSAGFLEAADTRAFVVACALAFLVAGVGLRAAQIHAFISDDLRQLPAYRGRGRRVEFIDVRHSFYGADLVQNDPRLRGKVIRLVDYGPKLDAAIMRKYFPSFREVYADPHGTVWVARTAAAAAPVR